MHHAFKDDFLKIITKVSQRHAYGSQFHLDPPSRRRPQDGREGIKAANEWINVHGEFDCVFGAPSNRAAVASVEAMRA